MQNYLYYCPSGCLTEKTSKPQGFPKMSIFLAHIEEKHPELLSDYLPKLHTCIPTETVVVEDNHCHNADVDIESLILDALNSSQSIEDTWVFSQERYLDHQAVIGAVKSLLVDKYVEAVSLTNSFWDVTEEGRDISEKGSPEYQVFESVPSEGGILMTELQSKLGDIVKIGLGPCMKSKWLKKQGDSIVRVTPNVSDETAILLRNVLNVIEIGEEDLKNLKRRKLIQQITRKSYQLIKGADFKPQRVRKMADLTKKMLGNKAEMAEGNTHWSDLAFKNVNLNSMGAPTLGGNYHPLLKVRAEFRRILMEMGFEEMPTNKWVESSFWNFDALFQPQSHPARDAHDTFFIKSPGTTRTVPEEYYEIVKATHESGGFGSIGYGRDTFKREEATKNLLRTHTTAISAQMLYRLAQDTLTTGEFKPKKYFSIDRVFRNEAMDATHLCEFHQVEGLIADRNLTLGHLIGTIRTFFEKIGITQLRFKPAYNPYTEPSMEIFGYHPELKKWTEIGNSGMFRPEMLRPMGLPSDVRVIAWGLSLERPTMIKYRIENIRDLFGHKADLPKQRNAPIANF